MASFKADKVQKNLSKKGFSCVSGHHHFFEFYYNEKLIVSTRTSHNGQDIDDYLISAMSKQCKVRKDFFKELVTCTKTQNDYEEELRQQGLI